MTGEKTGTAEIAKLGAGDEIEVLGPLGNGFLLEDMGDVILIGGGIGIPPMLELMKQLPEAGKRLQSWDIGIINYFWQRNLKPMAK